MRPGDAGQLAQLPKSRLFVIGVLIVRTALQFLVIFHRFCNSSLGKRRVLVHTFDLAELAVELAKYLNL
jgi:hypothetical protein